MRNVVDIHNSHSHNTNKKINKNKIESNAKTKKHKQKKILYILQFEMIYLDIHEGYAILFYVHCCHQNIGSDGSFSLLFIFFLCCIQYISMTK